MGQIEAARARTRARRRSEESWAFLLLGTLFLREPGPLPPVAKPSAIEVDPGRARPGPAHAQQGLQAKFGQSLPP
jgi:hypothetical protein